MTNIFARTARLASSESGLPYQLDGCRCHLRLCLCLSLARGPSDANALLEEVK